MWKVIFNMKLMISKSCKKKSENKIFSMLLDAALMAVKEKFYHLNQHGVE
jgi:hypothetical protein